jgi:hypothetical protein
MPLVVFARVQSSGLEGFGILTGVLGDRGEEGMRALSVMVYTWDIALKNERIQRHEVFAVESVKRNSIRALTAYSCRQHGKWQLVC